MKRGIPALVAVLVLAGSVFVGYQIFYEGSFPRATPERAVQVRVTETAPPSMNSDTVPETGDVWVSIIENAENSICIGAYYLDSAGPQWRLSDIYDSLKDAASRGVEVKIMVDSSYYNSEMVSELKNVGNLEVESWVGDGVLHSKYIIVDERIISLGSTNLSYYAMENHGGNREVNVTIRDGGFLHSYTYIFETGWKQAGGQVEDSSYTWSEDWITPVADGTGDNRMLTTIDAYRRLFNRAENQIYVYTYLYAGMPEEMKSSMENPLERGVEIKFLLDRHSESEHPTAVKNLDRRKNVEVFIIDHPHAAHAKFAVADERWCYIGSSNIHPEWMYEGRQIGVLLKSKDVADTLVSIYQKDWLSVNTHEYS